jgi:hypothetical protein
MRTAFSPASLRTVNVLLRTLTTMPLPPFASWMAVRPPRVPELALFMSQHGGETLYLVSSMHNP